MRTGRPILATLGGLAVAALALHACLGRHAQHIHEGRLAAVAPYADDVAHHAVTDPTPGLGTGSPRFDGEWALVTCQMTVLGLGQLVRAHPDQRERWLPGLRACADRLARVDTRAFGTAAWGEDGLAATQGHAYLGYIALALGMARLVDPSTPHAALHDVLVQGLADRLEAAPAGLIETYPGEIYPADVAVCIGALGLAGRPTAAILERFEVAVDPASGLLVQATDRWGAPRDGPRASGTALAAYALSYADPQLAGRLHSAVARQQGSLAGLAAIREHPDRAGFGDVDSGPLIFGYSPSASGFALAGARQHGDRRTFLRLHRAAQVVGLPLGWRRRHFLVGGKLADAILLAMVTAPAP